MVLAGVTSKFTFVFVADDCGLMNLELHVKLRSRAPFRDKDLSTGEKTGLIFFYFLFHFLLASLGSSSDCGHKHLLTDLSKMYHAGFNIKDSRLYSMGNIFLPETEVSCALFPHTRNGRRRNGRREKKRLKGNIFLEKRKH